MDPFLSDRHARWHPVDLSLFPLRPPPCVPPSSRDPYHLPGVPEPSYCRDSELEAPPARRAFLVVGRQK